ncbi:hypothetical protein NC651_022023 [Populus alba x Populus x berolinensis]|nr:hypothetical protein NC651_022023 [Populus alba x Populus x berolinensis]
MTGSSIEPRPCKFFYISQQSLQYEPVSEGSQKLARHEGSKETRASFSPRAELLHQNHSFTPSLYK